MRFASILLIVSIPALPWPVAAAAAADGQDLARSVSGAIDRGRAALLPRLEAYLARPPQDYPMGRIALCLAALLKAGLPSHHATAARALAELEALPLRETYSAACYLFALDAYWQSRHRESVSVEKQKSGRTSVPAVPRIPDAGPVRDKMAEIVAWLVRGSGGTWSYGGRAPGDLSNSQFAILGLEIGLQNGIEIPTEVFRAIAGQLTGVHVQDGEEAPFTFSDRTAAWEGVTAGVSRLTSVNVAPGGWSYEMSTAAAPSHTMTAAGVSSLLVARRALRELGEWSGDLARTADVQINAGLAWMSRRFAAYRNPSLYGLYSFEKAGDIGGIHRLGAIDWYADGAAYLLKSQRPNGSWGDEVNTSFALLFLTRATRSHLQALGPPVHYTRGASEGGKEQESDLVHVESLRGFVSTRTIFEFALETRDPALVPLLEAAVRGCPPHRIQEILARLLGLWTDADPLSRFAQQAIEQLTGAKKLDRAALDALTRDLERLRELEKAGADPENELAAILAAAPVPLAARRALDLVDRLGQAQAFAAVIDCLKSTDADTRRRAREILHGWTDAQPAPAGAAPAAEASAWGSWWAANGEEFSRRREAIAIVAGIQVHEDPQAIESTVARLVALGEPARQPILAAMERGEYSVHLARALSRITGKSAGLRPEDWRRALAR